MFEWHGWATIRFTPENRDIENEDVLQDAAVESVRTYAQQHWPHTVNELVDVRPMNGEWLLWTEGHHNHKGGSGDALQALFRHIAEVAPGSYGLLYTLDDEELVDPGLPYVRVYVLALGAFTERRDPFLSPFVPVVEDPCSDS